jgi:hypothetical protein
MDFSDNVEDGEIEEAETEVKTSAPPIENRFATPPVQLQNRDGDDNRAYYRGGSDSRGAEDYRYAQDRRNDTRPQGELISFTFLCMCD